MSSIKSNKDRILEKIDEKINELQRRLDRNPNLNSNDFVDIAGAQDAFYSLKGSINSIDVESIDVKTLPQYLETDDIFLNAAYHQAVLLKEDPHIFQGGADRLGETGKEEAIEEIMDYIKSLV